MMFAPNLKGTANAFTGGWGNLGGGVTNMVMPLIFAAIVGFGFTKGEAWRYAMIVPGLMLLVMAFCITDIPKILLQAILMKSPRVKRICQKTDWSLLAGLAYMVVGRGLCYVFWDGNHFR